MIIGIDGNEANVDTHVGVSVYTLELLKYFAKHASENTQFTIFLRTKPKTFLPKESLYFRYEVVPGKILWSQLFLPYHLMRSPIDVFFAPAHYAPRMLRKPLVLTIHDLSYFYYPNEFLKKDLYKLTQWTQYSVNKARKIIAVSKTTKKDVVKWYQIPDQSVTVVYNGFKKAPSREQQDEVLETYNLTKKKYVLYVGTLQPRKNLPVLIQAFDEFKKKHDDFQLVLTGKKGWLFDEIFEEVQKRGLAESVLVTGYETDEHLTVLYQNAFCFVLPSLYEGFGIPILEAMSHGCPVISSHASSLPEIGGDACLYFDPQDDQDLLEKLIQLHENKELQKSLIQAGTTRIKEFSWEKCGKETLSVIIDTYEHTHNN